MRRLSILAIFLTFGCSQDDGTTAPELPDVAEKSSVKGLVTAAEPWWRDSTRFPYDSKRLADWTQYQWRNQLNIKKNASPTLTAEVKRVGASMHDWTEGNGYVVADFHGLEVKLPKDDPRRSAQALLAFIRDNPGQLGGGALTTDFSDEVTWPSTAPGETRKPGEFVALDIYGPDNAGIAYIDVDISDQQFCVITVTHAQTGWHPVNGIRCWGYIEWPRGDHYTHMFYTTGVDSPTIAGSGWIGAPLQYETWNSMMVALARQVECKWDADAGYIWEDDEVQNGIPSTPGAITLADVDHLGGWDSITDATPQFEYACPGGEWDDTALHDVDSDQDGINDDTDLCANTPQGAPVWKEGEWIGCASGQSRT